MDFAQERAAFFAGYGRSPELIAALRTAVLCVPLDVHERFFTLVCADIPWMVAFTSADRLRQFAVAAERDVERVQVCEVVGGDLIDVIATQSPEPTGLVVDAHQDDVMVFPPGALHADEQPDGRVRTDFEG